MTELLKVDLGCGSSKPDGFIGFDRMKMPGVDVVGDINGRLPFDDNSVGLLFASHSLEHAADIMSTMREIYRICAHGAQVCIVAPYHDQKLNIANPYHLNVFNEHTPRFWTNSRTVPISKVDYWHPHAEFWGLAESDNSDPGVDFRLARMEFFYFPQYLHLDEVDRRVARSKYFDVCDQILYHLVVWKRNDDDQIDAVISNMEFFEPPYIQMRRQKDVAILKNPDLVDPSTGAFIRSFGDLHRAEKIEQQLNQLKLDVGQIASDRLTKVEERFSAIEHELEAGRRAREVQEAVIKEKDRGLDALKAECEAAQRQLDELCALLQQAWVDALSNAHEVSLFRSRRITKLIGKLRLGDGLRKDLSPAFGPMLMSTAAGDRIVIGPDLRTEDFVPYVIRTPASPVQALEIAVLSAVSNLGDDVGVEIVCGGRIVWNDTASIDNSFQGPLRFKIEAKIPTNTDVEVRVFSRTRLSPLYPLEVSSSRLQRRRRLLALWH